MTDTLTPTEREELETLRKQNKPKELHCKVSQKGAVSLYGLGRFPVTLYKEQWQKVFSFIEKIKAFVIEHDGELKTK